VAGHTFTQVRTGGDNVCALDPAQQAWCWGRGDFGILGTGDTLNRIAPDSVRGGHHFTQLALGYLHTCALETDGSAWCWGQNYGGELGVAPAASPEQCRNGVGCSTVPIAVQGGLHFTQIVAGFTFACALDAAGKAWCWGSNLSQVIAASSATPVAVPGGLSFTAITGKGYHVCGLTSAGAAYCWGGAGDGRLGNGTENGTSSTPQPVSGGLTFQALGAGLASTCGVATGGALYCWGRGIDLPLGVNGPNQTVPVRALSTY
jgi:alpha-tubulin suppressor-like RCC1 family protein